MDRQPCVYILASKRHGTLYIGVTSDLRGRLHQHRNGLIHGFTLEYGVKRLVYFEAFEAMEDGILREKRLKKWRHNWKIELIEARNPHWQDLALGMGFPPLPTEPPSMGSRFRGNDEVDG